MSVKWLLGKIASAELTFKVGRDKQLASLPRRKATARIRASHGTGTPGLHRIRTKFSRNGPSTPCSIVLALVAPRLSGAVAVNLRNNDSMSSSRPGFP